MKTYSLGLYFKQGDDFADYLKEAKSNASNAFDLWGKRFAQCQAVCSQLSRVFKTCKVSIQADTHMIMITPDNADSARALETLVKEGILTRDE